MITIKKVSNNLATFLIVFVCINCTLAQDSISTPNDISEEKNLTFQKYFFKALSENAIGNFKNAIKNLNMCNDILPHKTSVYFQLSKNYLSLKKTNFALEYINKALKLSPNNRWLLKHLVAIYKKENNYSKAIKTQKQLVLLKPSELENLVSLYFTNSQLVKADSIIKVIKKESILSENLIALEKYIGNKINPTYNKQPLVYANENISLENQFLKDQSYTVLQQLLNKHKNNTIEILKYANIGLTLYPSQAYLYYIKANTLNKLKKYKKALECLQIGIDFVTETSQEIKFYTEIAVAYKGLGNLEQEKLYLQKINSLK